MINRQFAALMSGFAMLVATPVAALASQDEFSVTVRTSDLDLTTTQGRQTLANRLDDASNQFCAVNGSRGLSVRVQMDKCKTQFARISAPQVERAVASAYEAKETGIAARSADVKITG